MSTAAVPLQALAQRINQHEVELAQLQQAFATRQSQLTQLTHRKEQLEAQLQQVEAEIEAVGSKDTAPPITTAKPAPAPKTPPVTKAVPAASQTVTLPRLLVQIVQQARRPVTIKELADQIVQRKYPTTTRNIPGLVKSRVGELVRKGVFRRLPNHPGVVLAKSPAATSPTAKPSATASPTAKTGSATHPSGPKKMPTGGTLVPHKPAGSAPTSPTKPAMLNKPTPVTRPVPALAPLLVQLLAKSTRPLKARELAEQAKAVGYQTTSRDFTNVVWVAVGKLKNVENVKGLGYRLKKGKTSNPGR